MHGMRQASACRDKLTGWVAPMYTAPMQAAPMQAAPMHVAPMHGPRRFRQLLAITTFYVANTAPPMRSPCRAHAGAGSCWPSPPFTSPTPHPPCGPHACIAHSCRCRQLLAITTFYVANTALSLGGLSKLNVPMYTTLKRLTPIFVLVTKVQPGCVVQPGVTSSDLV